MTMPIHINTLEYAKKLTAAGIPQGQAEAHALALGDTLSQSVIVVPGDLELLRTDILARFDVFKVEVYARLDAFEHYFDARLKTLSWMVAASTAVNVVINTIVLVKLFSLHS